MLNVEHTAVRSYCEVYLAASHDVVQEGIDSVKLKDKAEGKSQKPRRTRSTRDNRLSLIFIKITFKKQMYAGHESKLTLT